LKPAPTLAPPEPLELEEDEPRKDGSSAPWVIFLLVIVVAASGYFAWSKANAPFEVPNPDPRNDEPTPVRTVEVDAGAATPIDLVIADAGDVTDASVAMDDAGAPVEAVIDAGPPAPVELPVTIDSRPALELAVDGVVVGKTPWTGPLAMGPHKLKLENKELLLSASRTLTVQGSEPITQTYAFEKGTVGVNAPPGAVIFIDARKQGVAPLASELSIYEGYHRILVKVGQAQWTETFSLFGGQRVSFNVELE
jgi:hypothetical protein